MGIDELVLVVPRGLVVPDRGWRGVTAERLEATLDMIASEARFEPRRAMERDPGFKQVIPYLVLRDADRYFLMRRSRAGGDDRLHDRYSIGVGGHLNPGDADVHGGLVREWHEELVADFTPRFRLVGLLNDDETDVGRVHLGIVYVAEAAGRPIAVRETDKLRGAFVRASEVEAVRGQLETWSELVFDFLQGFDGSMR